MAASIQKSQPLSTLKIDDLIIETSLHIFISEHEYLELKSSVTYWRGAHNIFR
jgi:hypothetical protein